MAEKEQSAIDVIYKLAADIEYIKKQIEILDSNIKLLNNKISKQIKSQEPVAASSLRRHL
jgi:prefoldin subunit 5